MIHRANYTHINDHLQYLSEVMQVSASSTGRYRFYLRHLLLWADETLLAMSNKIRPAFPAYVASLPGKDGIGNLAGSTQKKIIESSKTVFSMGENQLPSRLQLFADTLDRVHSPL